MSTCLKCGQLFHNRLQLGAHVKSCGGDAGDTADLFSAEASAVIATPVQPPHQISLHSLCRREKSPWGQHKQWSCDAAPTTASGYARDYRPVQDMWAEHVRAAHKCCYANFWTVHETVRTQTAACRDAVLSVVKDLLGDKAHGHRWPRSSRILRDRSCTYPR